MNNIPLIEVKTSDKRNRVSLYLCMQFVTFKYLIFQQPKSERGVEISRDMWNINIQILVPTTTGNCRFCRFLCSKKSAIFARSKHERFQWIFFQNRDSQSTFLHFHKRELSLPDRIQLLSSSILFFQEIIVNDDRSVKYRMDGSRFQLTFMVSSIEFLGRAGCYP